MSLLIALQAHCWFEIINPLNEAVHVKVFFANNQYKEFMVLPNTSTGRLYANPYNDPRDSSIISRFVFVGTNPVIVGWNYNVDAPGNNWGEPYIEKRSGQFNVNNAGGANVKNQPLQLRLVEIPNVAETNLIRSQLPAVYDQLYPNMAIGGSALGVELVQG